MKRIDSLKKRVLRKFYIKLKTKEKEPYMNHSSR